MCRNIKVLFHFEPPTTHQEVEAAALQFVRKVSGATKPNVVDREAFDRAVQEVTASTERLLASLSPPKSALRTREGEREKAKSRWAKRAVR